MNDFLYINGVVFKEISNFIIDTDVQNLNFEFINDKDVVWCKTEFIEPLFEYIKLTNKRIILITHCSDHDINETRFSKKPNNVIKWFAQNVNFKHPVLIPLPIGLENHFGPHKGGYIDTEFLKKQNFLDTQVTNKIISHIYCNFTFTNTNRIQILNTISKKQIAFIDTPKPFKDYCEKMKEFLFVASPPGNGLDCHRTWEALYFGCIPIVQKHFMYDFYQELPIIQIEDWSCLDLSQYKEFIELYKNGKLFKTPFMLDKHYFFNKILDERKKI
jgi:hypothetical protein